MYKTNKHYCKIQCISSDSNIEKYGRITKMNNDRTHKKASNEIRKEGSKHTFLVKNKFEVKPGNAGGISTLQTSKKFIR